MPRAVFEADFSGFLDALNTVDVQLADMSAGAEKAGTAINRMIDQFSGRELIQQALELTGAIDQIGGAAVLTGNELEAVGKKANEAVEKMQALGYDVPKGLQELADATRQNVTATNDLSSAWSAASGVLGALGIATSVSGLINFSKEIIANTQEIEKLKVSTGLTSEEVQRLQFIAAATDTPLSAMTNAIENMTQRLGRGKGDPGLTAALAAFGVTAQELKSDPYDALLKINEGLQGISDAGQRADMAREIFGRGWKELAPAMAADMDQLGKQAPILADQYETSLKRIGDALVLLKQTAIKEGGEILAGMADAHAKFIASTGGATEEQARAIAQAGQLGRDGVAALNAALASIPKGDIQLPTLDIKPYQMSAQEITDANTRLTESAKALITQEEDQQKSQKATADILGQAAIAGENWKTTLEGISGETLAGMDYYRQLGVSVQELGKWYGLLPNQVRAYQAAVKDAQATETENQKNLKATEDLTIASYDARKKAQDKYFDDLAKATEDSTTYQINKVWEAADATIVAYEKKYGYSQEFRDAVNADADLQTANIMKNLAKQTDSMKGYTAEQTAAMSAVEFEAAAIAGKITDIDTATGQLLQIVTVVGARANEAASQIEASRSSALPGGSFTPAASGGATAGGYTDPRILNYLSMGYTLGEATSIVGGYGGSIQNPAARSSATGQATNAPVINIYGSVLSNANQIATVVGDALTQAMRNKGYTLPPAGY